MEPDYIHIPTENAIRSIYVRRLEDGRYKLEVDGDIVNLTKRGGKVEVDADEYYVQDGTSFWWFDGEEFIRTEVSIIDANYSTMFMLPPLLMAYAEIWPHVHLVVITRDGARKFTFDDDLSALGIKYRAGGKTGIIDPVIERGEYKKICLTCMNGFRAGIVIQGDIKAVDIITYHGFLSYSFRIPGSGTIELPEVGRIDLSQYV